VEINPADADKLKVSEGQRIKVTSRRGSVEAKATIPKERSGFDLYELPFRGRRREPADQSGFGTR